MEILFLTLARIDSINDFAIYPDLLRKFRDEGHKVNIVTPEERRYKKSTSLKLEQGCKLLKVWTPNLLKTNIIEKAFGMLIIEYLYEKAIHKYFKGIKFDLILYSTPPITFTSLIKQFKYHHSAKTYLLLKDIFPQNAVDLKMIKNGGFVYNYFRNKEKGLYNCSDWIGCMSDFNRKYLLKHNDWIIPSKVEVNPNSIFLRDEIETFDKNHLSYNIPADKTIFIYGGNLGKPQGIDFLIDVIFDSEKNNLNAFFIIVGSGTESEKINKWFKINQPSNALLINELPQKEYRNLIKISHVGLVFLHPDFTIPNYPSRILHYMENSLPIILATDENTDVGYEAEQYNYGLWCKSGDLLKFRSHIKLLSDNNELLVSMGANGYNRLKRDFNVDYSYSLIINHFNS